MVMVKPPAHLSVLLAVLAALAAAPGISAAATVEVGPDGVVYRAAPHEINDVTMRDAGPVPPRRSVVEASARLIVGPGCDPGAPILCSDLSHHKDVLRLGDRNDRASYFSNFADSYVYGEAGDDDFLSGGSTAYGYGGPGNDGVRVSSNGGSYAWGGPGNDVLEGIGKSDLLRGGTGNDVLRVIGVGPENAYGGPGNDRLELGGGGTFADSHARGGSGNDTLIVAADSRAGFELRGGPGNDLISSGARPGETDQIYGGRGNDRVLAADGNADTIECGAGRDSVEADHLDTVARSCEIVAITIVGPPASR